MIASPPHLPPAACSIDQHRQWERIKLISIAVFFGLLAGITGASVILGWVWPGLGGGDSWILSRNIDTATREVLSDQVRVELEDRVGVVYRDLSSAAGFDYLNQDKKIGEAFVVSSDGWLVMYNFDFDNNFKNWRVLLKNGNAYNVQKVLRDTNSNLVYLKISSTDVGAQFKVMSFGDDVKNQSDVFVFNHGIWKRAIVLGKIARAFRPIHLDSAPSQAYELNQNFAAGDIVATAQGKIVGVVSIDNYVLPGQYFTNVLPGVLSMQKVAYRSLGAYGWFSEEQPIVYNDGKISGFAVTKIFGDSQLRVGDVILEINGQIVTPDNLWYNVINNQSVKLKVLRKDKNIEVVQIIKQI